MSKHLWDTSLQSMDSDRWIKLYKTLTLLPGVDDHQKIQQKFHVFSLILVRWEEIQKSYQWSYGLKCQGAVRSKAPWVTFILLWEISRVGGKVCFMAEVGYRTHFSCLAAPEKWHQPTPKHVQYSLSHTSSTRELATVLLAEGSLLCKWDLGICPRFLIWEASNSIFKTSPRDIYWALHPLTFKCEMRYRPWDVFSLKTLHRYLYPRKEIKRNIRCTYG